MPFDTEGHSPVVIRLKVLVDGPEKVGCMVLFTLGVADLMDCLVVGSLC